MAEGADTAIGFYLQLPSCGEAVIVAGMQARLTSLYVYPLSTKKNCNNYNRNVYTSWRFCRSRHYYDNTPKLKV